MQEYQRLADLESSFQKSYFNHFGLLDQVVNSYNEVCSELQNIIQEMDLKYLITPKTTQNIIQIGFNFTNPTILLPGDFRDIDQNVNTISDAFAMKKTYTCQFNFDVEFYANLLSNQDSIKDKKIYIDMIQNKENNFQLYCDKYNNPIDVLKAQVTNTKLQFQLPILTGSKYDPVSALTNRQAWDMGNPTHKLLSPGDLIINGVPYIIQNVFSYPNNQPIIAATHNIRDQILRADYLYQQNPFYGNNYNNIFLLVNVMSVQKMKQLDLVLNFKQVVDFNFNNGSNHIPISLLFRAYGCQDDQQILDFCNPNKEFDCEVFFIQIFRTGPVHELHMKKRQFSQIEAIQAIGKIIASYKEQSEDVDKYEQGRVALYGLNKYIYELQVDETVSPYCQKLGEIAYQMYLAYKDERLLTDRDAIYNKRVMGLAQQIVAEMRGKLNETFKLVINTIQPLFENTTFSQLKTNINQQVLQNAVHMMSKNLTKSLQRSFTSSGDNVRINKNMNEFKTILLDINQKREIIIKAPSNGAKVSFDQRKIQQSMLGSICYITTPEAGDMQGRYLSPTIYSYTTQPQSVALYEDFIKKHKDFKLTMSGMSIKLNYRNIGYVDQWKQFYLDLLQFRQSNLLTEYTGNITNHQKLIFTSIYYNIEKNEINILSDAGRIMFPIFNQRYKFNDDFLENLQNGNIIYVCANMVQNFIISEFSDYTDKYILKKPTQTLTNLKIEDIAKINQQITIIQPSVLGLEWFFCPSGCISIFPASSPNQCHNKAVRGSYSTSQMKQAQSQSISNYMNIYVKNLLIINQQQRAMVETPFYQNLFLDAPLTNNVFMGICNLTNNQEDTMVVDEGFIKRYGFATSHFTSQTSEKLDKNERFQIPKEKRKEYNYDKLNATQGMITALGTNIVNNDVLIAKTKIKKITTNEANIMKEIDGSLVYQSTMQEEDGIFVSNVNYYLIDSNGDKKLVRYVYLRTPSQGDKLTSRNGQKSTIGIIQKSYLMPMTFDGIVLNMIQNTLDVIRRETWGQIIELSLSKWMVKQQLLFLNCSQDLFLSNILNDLSGIPQDNLWSGYKNEIMQGEIMCGCMAYTVQKHLVDEKIRARGLEGQIDQLSRQSIAGKQRNGGMRVADMEQKALGSAGIIQTLQGLYGKNGADTNWFICTKCFGCQVYYHQTSNVYMCPCCNKTLLEHQVIKNGYSYSPMIMETIMQSLGLRQRFMTDK